MKRDMDLVRSILLALEAHEHGFYPTQLNIHGFSEEQVAHHVYLMGQAGLLNVADVTHMQSPSPEAVPVSVTWEGHEFLELAREPSKWKRAIEKVTNAGAAMTIEVLKTVLAQLAKQALGIP